MQHRTIQLPIQQLCMVVDMLVTMEAIGRLGLL